MAVLIENSVFKGRASAFTLKSSTAIPGNDIEFPKQRFIDPLDGKVQNHSMVEYKSIAKLISGVAKIQREITLMIMAKVKRYKRYYTVEERK